VDEGLRTKDEGEKMKDETRNEKLEKERTNIQCTIDN
tara:strand:+ start:80 stop:190 length:111 start_codon:yes stop_codon:yes gene_type:complete